MSDEYDIRYFSGKTVRSYNRHNGLVVAGDHVVMEKQTPVARFRNATAAEVFCRDYKGQGWIVVDDPTTILTECPMCHRSPVAIVVRGDPPFPPAEKICRHCGYHTGHLHSNEQATVETRPGPEGATLAG